MAVIDLSQLPAPQIVDVPDFETLLAERKAEFVALHPKDEQEAVIRTLELESEPVTKLLQETGEAPGTFRLDIGVQDQGITEDTYLELERLISDAKPCSRHMIGMSINLQTSGPHWVGAASYLGEEITIYPYINETIISGGTAHEGGAVHVIDIIRVNP